MSHRASQTVGTRRVSERTRARAAGLKIRGRTEFARDAAPVTMANEEALGPRKTALVLVIVVGCFAVLWPRLLSPMFLGSRMSQADPDAGNPRLYL